MLTAGVTLAASLIWEINTIFLLDAGLTNFEAFAANACFTAGMLIFEIPTGIVADHWGRRASFLCGTLTLAVTTTLHVLLWQLRSGFVWWALVSALIGLGFTFFWCNRRLAGRRVERMQVRRAPRRRLLAGAGDCRRIDACRLAGRRLSRPADQPRRAYLVRVAILVGMFILAFVVMRDLGFTPTREHRPLAEVKKIVNSSVEHGLKVPAVRATMLAGMFAGGIDIYVYYALQPHLLNLWGDQQAYGIAGLVAALLAGAQIVGGLLTPRPQRLQAADFCAAGLGVPRDGDARAHRADQQLLASRRPDRALGTGELCRCPSGGPT